MASLRETAGGPPPQQEVPPEQGMPQEQAAPGAAPDLDAMLSGLREEDIDFDEALFERMVDRVRVGLFGGETEDGALSGETMAQLNDERGQAGPAGRAVNAAVEATLGVMQGAEEAGVEIPPAEGVSAGLVAVMDVADALDAMGQPLSPEEGVQAMYALVENLVARGVQSGVWDPDEAALIAQAIDEDGAELQEGIRSIDPEGAAVMGAEDVSGLTAPDMDGEEVVQ